MEIDRTLERLVREVLPRCHQRLALRPGMSLGGELGIDSIGLMSLAFRIEEEFHVDLMRYADAVANVQTIGDVQDLVRRIEGEQG